MTHAFKNVLVVIGLVVVGSLVATFFSVAATWTAPSGAPPGNNVDAPLNIGPLSQQKTGDLVISNDEVNAAIDVDFLQVVGLASIGIGLSEGQAALTVFGRIANVNTPIDSKDAVNKEYLEEYLSAQVSGARADHIILYGTGPSTAPGGNAPICPQSYPTEIQRGYGPHYLGVYYESTVAGGSTSVYYRDEYGNPVGTASESQPSPSVAVAFGSDSVCSASIVTAVNTLYTPSSGSGRQVGLGLMGSSACAPQVDVAGNPIPGQFSCNSCRICSTVLP